VGGNPFHHHQDFAKLRRAFQAPRTVVVHEQFWTSTARHADIVLPATMTIERDDFGSGRNDRLFFPMPALTEAAGEARDDYAIFAALEDRLGLSGVFTENRTVTQWLRHMYSAWQARLCALGHQLPDFDEFWAREFIEIPVINTHQVLHSAFRDNPVDHPLQTPSGRIEIFSETIDSFGYADCPGHPVWLEPHRRLGAVNPRYPLQLIANQPNVCTVNSTSATRASAARSKVANPPGCTLPTRRIEAGGTVMSYAFGANVGLA
jgi:biotin/methionine sulfoxide reductase